MKDKEKEIKYKRKRKGMAERLRERRVIYGGTNSNAPIKNVTKERTSKRKIRKNLRNLRKVRNVERKSKGRGKA